MHENNFEKQVREKMDHLGFDPSDAVWAGVDKEINKEKKHRRSLFWLFFFSGLILAGGGFYFTAIKNSSNRNINAKPENETNNKQDRTSARAVDLTTHDLKSENKTGGELSGGNSIKKPQPSDFQNGKTGEKNLISKPDYIQAQNTRTDLNGNGLEDSDVLKSGKNKLSSGGAVAVVPMEKVDTSAGNKTGISAAIKPPLKDSVNEDKMVDEKIQKKKSSPWKIGFTGNAGISSISQGLFKSAYTSYPAYLANSPSAGSPGTAPGGFYGSSNLDAGFAFGMGVMVIRNLSGRISFSGGLNYRYYSTKIYTGNKIDSSIYLYTTALRGSAVNSFYRNGSSKTYINQYHFIELPVTVSFQLNRSQKTRVSWEAGLSLAWLLSSNVLQYDPYSNVYFKDNQLLNRTQINAATAILVGFNVHQAELQLGPQVQYGLTGLLKGSTSSPEHIFYYGLKISFIPGNK